MATTPEHEPKDAVTVQNIAPNSGSDDADSLNGNSVGFTYHDRMDMRRMGKKQELMRNFRTFSSIAFTTCVMGTWEILLTANTQGLIAGGSAGLFWSLVWAYAGQAFVILSLAEMASIAPTAGGQYHWVSEFAPRKHQRLLSYTSGWLSTLAWQSFVAVDSFLVGEVILGMIVVNDQSFVAQRWQATLLIIATVLGLAAVNFFAGKRLALAENIFVAFHLPEEISNAGLVVPKSMVWSFFLNIPMTFGLLIAYLFCIGDVSDAISSPTGYPFIYVFQNATGSVAGTTGLTVVILLLLIVIAISSYASTSRQLFAFARDNGMPFSNWLARVGARES
ncbi:hypothetical protein OEA41_007333 [Lepraria neglecta]|uniref:Amino acid transporter n=1 Tax=Lepraria neglecta TaxID=209136 RepID=A0AAD9ZCI8_9LECA|nr:hypothetical protein OEA41_007333 [Lepraria neglecta]